MEVERGTPPVDGFLSGVRDLASKYGAVLIFDECTSGFRKLLGGLHLSHGVEPDVAVFGKTLGNGYAINAIIGRRNVMQAAQATFISSTFWTERIGPTAALAAIKAMADEDAPARIHKTGSAIRSNWAKISEAAGLKIQIGGVPALSTFTFEGRDPTVIKTFVTSELLKSSYLASSAIYVSVAHTEKILDNYLERLSKVFQEISNNSDVELMNLLPNGVAQAGFKRLA
jgi:glutamate-1-semialdehyde aminotransferase